MTVTTLPFMEAVELEDGPRDGWYRIDCDLCGYGTHDGAFHVCQDEAIEHLEERHPRRFIGAQELDRVIRLAINTHGYDSPEVDRLLKHKQRRGM
jgi:hypothetical protein